MGLLHCHRLLGCTLRHKQLQHDEHLTLDCEHCSSEMDARFNDYVAAFRSRWNETSLFSGASASESLFAPDDLGYTIKGEGGHDHIKGGEANDILRGGSGDDWIEGFGGNDTIFGGQGDDVVCGDSGNDFIKGKSGNDLIYGGSGFDILKGNSGDDILYGGDNSDILTGGRQNDILHGENGNDWLDGGTGADRLIGGDGADVFILSKGNDIIEDYSLLEDSKIRINADVFTEVSLSIGFVNGQETLSLIHNHCSTVLMGVDSSSFSIADNVSFT